MSYYTQALIAQDAAMNLRVTTAYASENVANGSDPQMWASSHRWEWGTAPGWDEAWESAEASGNLEPGKDSSVITDAMILTEVQSLIGA
jgi:hypothetical protein